MIIYEDQVQLAPGEHVVYLAAWRFLVSHNVEFVFDVQDADGREEIYVRGEVDSHVFAHSLARAYGYNRSMFAPPNAEFFDPLSACRSLSK
jgi:hypothetical protein